MLIPSPALPGSGSEGISQSRKLSEHPLSGCEFKLHFQVTKLNLIVNTLVKREIVTNETIRFANEL